MEDTKKTLRAIKWRLRDLCWDFYGRRFRNPVLPKSPDSFLFLCKGNICRSPFAERLTRKVLQANGCTATRICSAGLEVTRKLPAPEEAVLAAREFGVSLQGHRSQQIELSMLKSFSMIVVMEAGQLKVLKRIHPTYADKFFLLPLFEKNSKESRRGYPRYNLADPYGKELEEFRVCYRRIQRCLEELFGELGLL